MHKPSIRSAIWLFLVSGLMLGGSAVAEDPRQQVVYHINFDDPARQAQALSNIRNHIEAVGIDELKLQVVLHGRGISLLLLPEAVNRIRHLRSGNATVQMQAHIDELRTQGVDFKICAASLRRYKANISRDFHESDPEDIVPSGIAHLAELQMHGYVYIKP